VFTGGRAEELVKTVRGGYGGGEGKGDGGGGKGVVVIPHICALFTVLLHPAAITMSFSPLASSTRNSAPVTNDDFANLAL
jgi:hypothetical protein